MLQQVNAVIVDDTQLATSRKELAGSAVGLLADHSILKNEEKRVMNAA